MKTKKAMSARERRKFAKTRKNLSFDWYVDLHIYNDTKGNVMISKVVFANCKNRKKKCLRIYFDCRLNTFSYTNLAGKVIKHDDLHNLPKNRIDYVKDTQDDLMKSGIPFPSPQNIKTVIVHSDKPIDWSVSFDDNNFPWVTAWNLGKSGQTKSQIKQKFLQHLDLFFNRY